MLTNNHQLGFHSTSLFKVFFRHAVNVLFMFGKDLLIVVTERQYVTYSTLLILTNIDMPRLGILPLLLERKIK